MAEGFAAKYGPWAVIAGASEGLGAAYARVLAERGVNLLLLARRESLLAEVADGLRALVEVRARICDVGRPEFAAELEAMTADVEVGLGIYNAAYAPVGELTSRPLDDLLRIVDVNVRGPLAFARTLAPQMIARKKGGLVLMSSLAGFQGAPNIAAYAASKAFNIVLAEGLWSELVPQGIDVLVSAAGAIRTPGYARSMGRDAPGTLDARAVAEATLDALGHGPLVVPGRFNRVARFAMSRLLSRRRAIRVMGQSTRELT
jgi:short-subunit dehydrogenase